jgi:hypothetical protein
VRPVIRYQDVHDKTGIGNLFSGPPVAEALESPRVLDGLHFGSGQRGDRMETHDEGIAAAMA